MIIGITGGIASGKSLITSRVKELGYKVYDCDVISHDLFEAEEIQLRLKEEFGIKSERVTRREISVIVFSDESKLKLLNNIMHPYILDELDKIIWNTKENEVVFIDVPLLYELHLTHLFNKVIFVYLDEDRQIERLKERDRISTAYAKEKIRKQLSMEEKKSIAKAKKHFILENNTGIEEAYKKLDIILKEIKNDI